MYRRFYQFTQKPFDVTPDPKFLYMSRDHQETLASIIYGIRERKGFIAVIGEVGTGKTTLLNAAIQELDKEIHSAFIFNTDVNFDELLMTVLIELGITKSDKMLPKYAALDVLNQYATKKFAAGENIVVFIDEAQNLDSRTMENLRLLSNLETTEYKLIQIVLAGQPELDEKLRKRELRQLAQRINLRRYIRPLTKKDTFQYILHHLRLAGYPEKKLFTKASLKKIWKFSRGIPRKINILCDNALLVGYGLGKKKISKSIVKEAIRDISWSPYVNYQKALQRNKTIEHYQSSKRITRLAYASVVLLLGFFLGAGTFNWQTVGGVWEKLSPMVGKISTDLKTGFTPASPPANEEGNRINASSDPQENIPFQSNQTKSDASRKTGHTTEVKSGLGTEDLRDQVKEVPPEPTTDDVVANPANDYVGNSAGTLPFDNFSDVVVENGDTLSWIVQERYGEYQDMLPRVIQANPQLTDPNLIKPGQVIRMPDVKKLNMHPMARTETPAS